MSDIDLIFGINADSLVFGRNIANVDGNMLVYVDSVIREDYETSIRDLGGLTFSDNDAVRATRSFLQNIRVMPNKTRLRLYALSGEYDRNLEYAQKMSNSLMEEGILPDQTELVLLGTDEMTQEELAQRVKEAQNEIREFGKSSIRPTRDKKT